MFKSAHLTGSISRKAGGLFDAVQRLVQARAGQGQETQVFGLEDEFTQEDLPSWKPVRTTVFTPSWPRAIGRAPKLAEELTNFAPDLCHTHGLWLFPSMATKNYSRRTNRPYLISPHGMLDPWAMQNSRWKKQIAWALFEGEHLRRAHCLRALCLSEAQSIRKLGLKNDIVVIPNGIDLPGNATAESRKAPWQDYVEPGKKVLLFLSRIHPKKGLVNLLKAWKTNQQTTISNRQSSEWILAIAGWDQGGHEAELKRLCSEQKIPFADVRTDRHSAIRDRPASVLFLGPQFHAAKATCYQQCDAFVLPSYSEGVPMVVLEAWAYSKPVVMTAACNLPEGFQAGAAIQVDPNENSIAKGLNNLFEHSANERETMGTRARKLVEQRFTWSRVGEQLQAVESWVLGGGTKPACQVPV